MANAIIDLTGRRFGHRTVLGDTGKRAPYNNEVLWLCECDCGQRDYVASSDLRRGHSRACTRCAYKLRGKEIEK